MSHLNAGSKSRDFLKQFAAIEELRSQIALSRKGQNPSQVQRGLEELGLACQCFPEAATRLLEVAVSLQPQPGSQPDARVGFGGTRQGGPPAQEFVARPLAIQLAEKCLGFPECALCGNQLPEEVLSIGIAVFIECHSNARQKRPQVVGILPEHSFHAFGVIDERIDRGEHDQILNRE